MDLAYELHDLVRTLDRFAGALLKPHSLSYHRYVALVVVGEHPGLTGRQLAAALAISEASTSTIVQRLMEDGLITDGAPTGSGHVRRLELSAEGITKRDQAAASLGDSFDRNVRKLGLDPQELARTIRAIHNEVRTPARGEQQ